MQCAILQFPPWEKIRGGREEIPLECVCGKEKREGNLAPHAAFVGLSLAAGADVAGCQWHRLASNRRVVGPTTLAQRERERVECVHVSIWENWTEISWKVNGEVVWFSDSDAVCSDLYKLDEWFFFNWNSSEKLLGIPPCLIPSRCSVSKTYCIQFCGLIKGEKFILILVLSEA